MMNRIVTISIFLLFSMSGFVVPVANAGTPAVRHARQQARIHAGVAKGALVPREAQRLHREQRHIQQSKRRMLESDGKLSPAERARLTRMQDRASHHIFNAKHNDTQPAR